MSLSEVMGTYPMSVRDESEDRSAHLDPVDHAQDLLVAALLADRAARVGAADIAVYNDSVNRAAKALIETGDVDTMAMILNMHPSRATEDPASKSSIN